MNVPYYQIDAFTDRVFAGNPAGVCLLEQWPGDATLQRIAAENNLSETAFLVPLAAGWHLRWFTPAMEMDLCGHATLAAGHVLFHHLSPGLHAASFTTLSGTLTVRRQAGVLWLDFPARPPHPVAAPDALVDGLGQPPAQVLKSRDYLAVYEDEAVIRALTPRLDRLRELDCLGIIVTAAGSGTDFVSRFFAPRAGIDEDPVTGSAHCTLIPYWARRLGKDILHAEQASLRGGQLACRNAGDRVFIGGHAVTYLEGRITVPEAI